LRKTSHSTRPRKSIIFSLYPLILNRLIRSYGSRPMEVKFHAVRTQPPKASMDEANSRTVHRPRAAGTALRERIARPSFHRLRVLNPRSSAANSGSPCSARCGRFRFVRRVGVGAVLVLDTSGGSIQVSVSLRGTSTYSRDLADFLSTNCGKAFGLLRGREVGIEPIPRGVPAVIEDPIDRVRVLVTRADAGTGIYTLSISVPVVGYP